MTKILPLLTSVLLVFEVFTPIILTGFPIEIALNLSTRSAMRKPFYGLAVASAMYVLLLILV